MSPQTISELAGIMFAFTLVGLAPHPEDVKTEWKDCVNQIAYEAYVEHDVDNTFDSGFDAGLVAAEICGNSPK